MIPSNFTPAAEAISKQWGFYIRNRKGENLDKVFSLIEELKPQLGPSDVDLLKAISASAPPSQATRIDALCQDLLRVPQNLLDIPRELLTEVLPPHVALPDLTHLFSVNRELRGHLKVALANKINNSSIEATPKQLKTILTICGDQVHSLDCSKVKGSVTQSDMSEILRKCPHLKRLALPPFASSWDMMVEVKAHFTQFPQSHLPHIVNTSLPSIKNENYPNLKVTNVCNPDIALSNWQITNRGDIFQFVDLREELGKQRVNSTLIDIFPPDWLLSLTAERRETLLKQLAKLPYLIDEVTALSDEELNLLFESLPHLKTNSETPLQKIVDFLTALETSHDPEPLLKVIEKAELKMTSDLLLRALKICGDRISYLNLSALLIDMPLAHLKEMLQLTPNLQFLVVLIDPKEMDELDNLLLELKPKLPALTDVIKRLGQ